MRLQSAALSVLLVVTAVSADCAGSALAHTLRVDDAVLGQGAETAAGGVVGTHAALPATAVDGIHFLDGFECRALRLGTGRGRDAVGFDFRRLAGRQRFNRKSPAGATRPKTAVRHMQAPGQFAVMGMLSRERKPSRYSERFIPQTHLESCATRALANS